MASAANANELRPEFGNHRVVLEGGSIDVNGCGTLLSTEECLLSKVQQRNSSMKRKDYEKLFAEYLGIKNVIWLDSGISGDDTHGHVDDLSRFVSRDTVVTMVEPNSTDENHAPLRANLRQLVVVAVGGGVDDADDLPPRVIVLIRVPLGIRSRVGRRLQIGVRQPADLALVGYPLKAPFHDARKDHARSGGHDRDRSGGSARTVA